MPLLEARGLTKRFGGVTALDGLDLAIEPGDVIGVMGPNGAGKSTLLKTLLGEIRPDAGDVLLDGHSVLGWPTHRIARSGVALANQLPRPFLRLTVAENVRVGALARGDRMRDVDVLELCGLADKAQPPGRHPRSARPQAPGDGPRPLACTRGCCSSTRSVPD